MKSLILTAPCLVLTLTATACQCCQCCRCCQKPATRPAYAPLPSTDQQALINHTRLGNFPGAVQTAFQQTHPEAGITGTDLLTANTGQLLYEVFFLESGDPGRVMYTADGREIEPAAPAVIPPQPPPTFPPLWQ